MNRSATPHLKSQAGKRDHRKSTTTTTTKSKPSLTTTTTTPQRSIKTRRPVKLSASGLTPITPTQQQSHQLQLPATVVSTQKQHHASLSPSRTPRHLRPKLTRSSDQLGGTAFSSSTSLVPQSLHHSPLPQRDLTRAKPGVLSSWSRLFSALNHNNNDNENNKNENNKNENNKNENNKNDNDIKKDGSDSPTSTKEDRADKPSPEDIQKQNKERVEKENKEKREHKNKDQDKNSSKWSSIPRMDSIKLNPASFQEMEPEKVVMWFLRSAIAFFALSQIVPAVSWLGQYRSRNTTTYHDILTNFLSKNRVEGITMRDKTAVFLLDDRQRLALDVISLPDFSARLAYDVHQLGLEVPMWSIPETPDLHILPLILLLQLATLPAMLSKTKNLFPDRSGPKIKKVENLSTRFNDVAGMDEAKNEIVEFVDFLREPEKYKKLGARLPKGALLSGPPGTGKTLLAKATAGEAGVSFYSVSGSEFQQMYVGMGAKRVRDLFKTARKNAPAIVFIDEIDSIAKKRSSRGNDGSSEREATLNQLLVEMDGFNTEEAVVVFAATNRAEMLDEAVTRAGRFDRKISVSAPDLSGREAVFNIHLSKLQLAHPQADVAKKIAALTPGMVGADIANVCNESAIGAARRNNQTVELVDFESAVDKVVGGLEKKEDMNNKKQREVVAYHEAGHALLGWFLEHTDPLLKVTIIPRTNGALGFAQYLPKDAGLQQTQHLRDMIAMALGGRAAEDLVYNKVSTGASDDLRQVARVAQGMILRYGMSTQFTNTAFATLDDDKQMWKSMSQKTNFAIDNEIMGIVSEEYQRAKDLLTDKRHLLEALGSELLAKETLNHDQLVAILGDRPFKSDHYVKYVQSRKEFVDDLKEEKKVHEAPVSSGDNKSTD